MVLDWISLLQPTGNWYSNNWPDDDDDDDEDDDDEEEEEADDDDDDDDDEADDDASLGTTGDGYAAGAEGDNSASSCSCCFSSARPIISFKKITVGLLPVDIFKDLA